MSKSSDSNRRASSSATAKNAVHLGVDLGGTKIIAVVTDAAGRRLAREKRKTNTQAGLDGIAETIHDACAAALEKASKKWSDAACIGIAVPSSVDPATGLILHAPNLGLKKQPARDVFAKVFGRPVFVGNDVNCGTFAEFKVGAGRGFRSIIGYFVGTGLGGGIIFDGQLVQGVRGMGGEVGHMIIRHKGRVCGCGHRGCLEAYCSKVAFGKRFHKLVIKKQKKSILTDLTGGDFANINSRALAQAYRLGDEITRDVINQGARMLGVATANTLALLGSELVVYGGGVMEELGDELLPVIKQGIDDHLFGLEPADVKLALAELGDDAVAIGAALLAIEDAAKGM